MQYVVLLVLVVVIVIGIALFGGGGPGAGGAGGSGTGGAASPSTSAVVPAQPGGPVLVEVEGHRYLVGGAEVTVDRVKELAKAAGDAGSGPRVRIKKRDTSRATAEQSLRDGLQAEGISFVEE